MKNKLHTIIQLVITLSMMIGLIYFAWQTMLWKSEALNISEFAAKLWAAQNFSKGKHVKLTLEVLEDPKQKTDMISKVDGGHVLMRWVSYTDPLFPGTNSPSVQAGRLIVDTYNLESSKIWQNPSKYKKRLQKEIMYWQTNVLGKENVSNN